MGRKFGWILYVVGCIFVACGLYFFTSVHPKGSCREGYSKFGEDSYIMRGRYRNHKIETFTCIKE